jgi:S-adenosylmethionine:tRNA ribosyltransferase-isomerase
VRIDEFDYELPPERIAQRPAPEREGSRLLVLDRTSGAIDHRRFAELPELLRPGDLVVLNDTRVVPARLVARKPSGGRVELLLVERTGDPSGDEWRCLLRSSRKPEPGARLALDGGLSIEVVARDGESWRVRLPGGADGVEAALERVGRMPLPPYIRRDDAALDELDRERYQTVYAREPGAVAAPTAGLHFSTAILDRLRARGIDLAFVTLHVGTGTFRPVRAERIEDHEMETERYVLPEATASAIARTRQRGGRVVAVGTTVVRVLESCAAGSGVEPGSGRTSLFVRPGHAFSVVDALVTNFHLPRSTLLVLVCAFAGCEPVLAAYREAVAAGYRFYSYGDAMLVGTP